MTKTEKLFQQIAATFPEGTISNMFGATCIKAPNGKAVFLIWQNDLVFKLTGQDEKVALSLDGTKIYEPAPGRKMGGWIQIPLVHSAKWAAFAKKSYEYVKSLENQPTA